MPFVPAIGLFGTLGPSELIIILVILLLIFGGTKLPQLARAMGRSIKEFKSEMKDGQATDNGAAAGANPGRFCAACGSPVSDAAAQFCAKCGHKIA